MKRITIGKFLILVLIAFVGSFVSMRYLGGHTYSYVWGAIVMTLLLAVKPSDF